MFRCGVDYGARHPEWHASDADAKAQALVRLVEQAGLRPQTVLDVGCGPGFVLDALARHWPQAQLMGVEPSPLPAPRDGIVQGTLEAFPDLRADLVCALDVMEHTEDDAAFLSQLAERGPWLALRIPLDISLVDGLTGRTSEHRVRYGHRHAYTRRRALARVRSVGLEVVAEAYHALAHGGRLASVRQWGAARWPHATYRVLGGASLMVLARAPV